MAKGRLIGLQFDALFTDNLYLEISKHAIEMAEKMKQMFAAMGYKFFLNSPTNQQFVIIPNDKMKELEHQVMFTHWEPYDAQNFVCRFVTSWATTDEDLNILSEII